jgi:hypothetical protein
MRRHRTSRVNPTQLIRQSFRLYVAPDQLGGAIVFYEELQLIKLSRYTDAIPVGHFGPKPVAITREIASKKCRWT